MLRIDQKSLIFSSKRSRPPLVKNALMYPGICAVNAKFIYLTGGIYLFGGLVTKCSHRYDIVQDLWLEMQPMHQARSYHSSC